MSEDLTRILQAVSRGEENAAQRLLPLIYEDLRRLARHRVAQENPVRAPEPTSLVHDAYLRLIGPRSGQTWANRAHFFAAAAEAMRRILVEKARSAGRRKRGGDRKQVSLDDTPAGGNQPHADLLDLDLALQRLERIDPRMSDVVKLRYFVGFSVDETAEALAVAPRTVDRQWTAAKAWLHREMQGLQSEP